MTPPDKSRGERAGVVVAAPDTLDRIDSAWLVIWGIGAVGLCAIGLVAFVTGG